MERLTKRMDNGDAWYNHRPDKIVYNDDLLQRLAYYEDMEEQGRLVVLPCKLGSKVYVIEAMNRWDDDNRKCVIEKVIYPRFVISFLDTQLVERELGKTVFLTREEAEQALKEGADHVE